MKYDKTYLSIRDKRALRKWIKALRSGKYQKVCGKLWNEDHTKHCCLGVYCEVGLGKPFIPDDEYPPKIPEDKGLMSKCFGDYSPLTSVWQWNDLAGMDFIQIANRLEMLLDMSRLPHSLQDLDDLYRRCSQ
jgi:hypothetical protein